MPKVQIPNWHDNAKCAGKIGEFDMPARRMLKADREKWDARIQRACAGCPVMRECAQDALDNPQFAQGVVRAGYAITHSSGTARRRRVRNRWMMIANG